MPPLLFPCNTFLHQEVLGFGVIGLVVGGRIPSSSMDPGISSPWSIMSEWREPEPPRG